MWEESLIESQNVSSGRRKFFTFPVAVAIHGAVILGLAASNYAIIEAVNPAHIVPIFWKGDPPPKGTLDGNRAQTTARRSQSTPTQEHQPIVAIPVPMANPSSLEPGGEEEPRNGSGEGTPFGIPEGFDGAHGNSGIGFDEGQKQPEIEIIRPGVSQPLLVHRVEPEYPRLLRISHVEGYVILQAVITKEGNVQVLQVLKSDHPLFEKSTLEAVRQWSYRPAMLNNHPVAVYFQITVHFRLK